MKQNIYRDLDTSGGTGFHPSHKNMHVDKDSSNYTCSVVRIEKIFDIEGADRIQRVLVNGNDVVTSKEVKLGDIMLYFVAGTKLNEEYCKYNDLLTDETMNRNKVKGYISHKQFRVKAINLRGVISNGMLLPVSSLNAFDFYPKIKTALGTGLSVGEEFTHLFGVKICEKYIVPERQQAEPREGGQKKTVRHSRLVDNQFVLHNDTANLRKNIHKINPDDIIGIHYKKHGTSFSMGNVLVKRKLSIKDRIAKFFGANINETEYDVVYASRKVVKNKYLENANTPQNFDKLHLSLKKRKAMHFIEQRHSSNGEEVYRNIFPTNNEDAKIYTLSYIDSLLPGFRDWFKNQTVSAGFYGTDIWGIVKEEIGHLIPKGWTLYGEIVGYLPDGSAIQKGLGKAFDYGCAPGEHDTYIYKISVTNPDGTKVYLSDKQIQQWCNKVGLKFESTLMFYGRAEELFPMSNISIQALEEGNASVFHDLEGWRESFLSYLEKNYNEKDCHMCVNKLPEEGIVLRKEDAFEYEAYKLKSKRFILMESDEQEQEQTNIEDNG